jgi:eukaryotic-like serine/threonine-protein kinase
MGGSFEAGQRVGPYALLRLLARGGMAEIWLARTDRSHGVTKTVVLKRILAARSDDGRFRRMFVGEARVAMGFDHGNVAQVFDFFEEDGEYLLVMEFVDGKSLYDLIRLCRKTGLRFPWPHAAHVLRETARGLHHAHTRTDEDGAPLDVVHRDVSPQNVLVGFDGQVKVVDFGIARARTVASETRAGVAKGKYLYFSPEQARGLALDRRTDVYACGVILYQLVTGRLPVGLDVPYAEALARIVHGSWPTPREIAPEIPESLEAIVLEAMTVDPEARFQSAHELEVALGGWLHAEAPRTGSEDVAALAQFLAADALAEAVDEEDRGNEGGCGRREEQQGQGEKEEHHQARRRNGKAALGDRYARALGLGAPAPVPRRRVLHRGTSTSSRTRSRISEATTPSTSASAVRSRR